MVFISGSEPSVSFDIALLLLAKCHPYEDIEKERVTYLFKLIYIKLLFIKQILN